MQANANIILGSFWLRLPCKHGYNIVMHGASGHTLNRVYTEQVLNYLGYPICQNDADVEQQLKDKHFAYLPLEVISPNSG